MCATTTQSRQRLNLFKNEDLGQILTVPAGEVIFDTESAAEHVYFVRRGQVRLYMVGPDGSSRLLEILGAGDWFGAAALAGLAHQGKRAVAITTTVLSAIPVAQLRESLLNSPAELIEMTRQLSQKLMSAYRDAASLVFEDCHARLVETLLRFSTSAASAPREDGVALHITHDQLAQAIGVARETVSLALTELREKNLLRTGRNQLVFNPDALRRFALRNEQSVAGDSTGTDSESQTQSN